MAIARSLVNVRVLGVVCAMLVAAAALPAASQAAAPASHDRVEQSVIHRINAIRAHFGLRALKPSGALARAADAHSADMLRADYFAHDSSNGQGMEARVEHFRHSRWVGETLGFMPAGAAGQASGIVRMWMNSAQHRAELLSRRFTRIGVARRTGTLGSGNATVFTADLASRR